MPFAQPFFRRGRWTPLGSPAWLRTPRISRQEVSAEAAAGRGEGLFARLREFLGGKTEPKTDWSSAGGLSGDDDSENEGPAVLGRGLQAFDTQGTLETCIFGFEVEELPEFVLSPSVTQQGLPEKVAEALQQWTQVIREMHLWQAAAYSLRFLVDPSKGRTRVAMLGRVVGSAGDIDVRATGFSGKLGEILERVGIRGRALGNAAELDVFLDPFPAGMLCEVRQADSLMSMNEAGERTDNYMVAPYVVASGSWLNLFAALVQQAKPVMVSLHLEPTEALPQEADYFSQAADYAKKVEQFEFRGNRAFIKEHSMNAAMIGRLYTDLQIRLQQPYLGLVQVAGTDVQTMAGVAALFEAALSEPAPAPAVDVSKAEATLPPRALRSIPGSREDLLAARCTLTDLMLMDWLDPGQPVPRQPCQRLRYLLDAKGAAAMFRLPIATGNGVAGIKTFRPKTGYETGSRVAEKSADHVMLGTQANGGIISVAAKSLSRHMLVAGIPGSGKTNTSLGLLAQVWRDHQIPFMVIEPIKQEYRGLASVPGFDKLQVFTLGDERTSPFRLNPLELLPDITVEEHISGLLACFRAAMPQDGPLPMLIEEAVRGTYKARGWRSSDVVLPNERRTFPMLRDVYQSAERAVDAKNYGGEVKQNIMGALRTRLGSLLLGAKGRMFNCERGVDVAGWMTVPTVFELERIRDPEQKTLPILFIVLLMREYSRIRPRKGGALVHVTLIEEAHNIMAAPGGAANRGLQADTAGQAAKDLGNMLHEMRGLGEGIIVAEQTPTLLNRAAVDLTMTKIVHRLSSPGEAEVLGAAMIMEGPEHKSLQNLRTGEAAVFAEGLEGVVYVKAPNFKDGGNGFAEQFAEQFADPELRRHMRPFREAHETVILPFDACRLCRCPCKVKGAIEPFSRDPVLQERMAKALKRYAEVKTKFKEQAQQAMQEHYAVAVDAARLAGVGDSADAAWCFLSHSADEDKQFSKETRAEFDHCHAILVGAKKAEGR